MSSKSKKSRQVCFPKYKLNFSNIVLLVLFIENSECYLFQPPNAFFFNKKAEVRICENSSSEITLYLSHPAFSREGSLP